MKRYYYFVAWFDGRTFGNGEFSINYKIDRISDIHSLESEIRECEGLSDSPIIFSYQLLRTEDR